MDSPIVEIQQGKLRGDTGTDFNGQPFLRFQGIPYAKPPVGELRFKVAQPPETWSGIRDATKPGDCCFQNNFGTTNVSAGSEDCLNLNVFTKEPLGLKTSLKPVMVYIHGGAFTMGSNDYNFENPEYLMSEDIVLVVINYRIGILGFLCVEDFSLNIPGNNGLKDQNLALKWVQKNISKFGGDPKNVTIFGHSAGAASIDFHILSPMSKGLFHKAILHSGCAMNPWAWGSRGNAVVVAEILGHKVANEKEAVEILKQTPVKELYESQLKIPDSLAPSFRRPFGPVIEEPNESAFLTKEPLELLMTGEYNQVPLILGYTDREGLLIELSQSFKLERSDEWEQAIPWTLNITSNSKEHDDIITQFKNIYKGPDKKDNEYLLYSDSMFIAQIIENVKFHLKTGSKPIFLYKFTLETKLNFLKNMLQLQNVKGVSHGDDIGYLFKIGPQITPDSLEGIFVKRYGKLLTNFAKNGNPTDLDDPQITWKPVRSETHIDYLNFGEQLVMEVNPESERMQLWKELFEKYPMVFNNIISRIV